MDDESGRGFTYDQVRRKCAALRGGLPDSGYLDSSACSWTCKRDQVALEYR